MGDGGYITVGVGLLETPTFRRFLEWYYQKNLIQFPVEHQNVGELFPSFILPPPPGRFFFQERNARWKSWSIPLKGVVPWWEWWTEPKFQVLNQPTWTTNTNKPLVEMIRFWLLISYIWIRFLVIFGNDEPTSIRYDADKCCFLLTWRGADGIVQRSIFPFLLLDSNPETTSLTLGWQCYFPNWFVKTKSNKANFHHDSSTGEFSPKKRYFMSSDDLIELLERYTAIRDQLKRHKGPVRMLFFHMKLGSPNNNECQVSNFNIFELRSYPPWIFHLTS